MSCAPDTFQYDIRKYNVPDRGDLIDAINAVCAENRWMETSRYEPTPSWEHALTDTRCDHHLLLVALCQRQLVGWCRAFPEDQPGERVIGIGVIDDYRNHGIGQRLLAETKQWAVQSKLDSLRLFTRANNARAIHVFQKVGFIIVSHQSGQGFLEMVCRVKESAP